MKTAMIGWRGMVGSVLLQRMAEEGDFDFVEADFFSTTQAGTQAPRGSRSVLDASDIGKLAEYQVVVTCQGGAYTESTYDRLRDAGWEGVWIDAASTLRMRDDCVIVLDPVNGDAIEQALARGVRTFAGGNCTVSLMLLAILPLLERGWVNRVTTMTYQAVSGAGAAAVLELIEQTKQQVRALEALSAESTAMQRADVANRSMSTPGLSEILGVPIASSVIPWIDRPMPDGRTREEWKGQEESNKILGHSASGEASAIQVDGLCVRVPVFRCHSQAITLELASPVPLNEIEAALRAGHEWLDFVPNDRTSTLERLTPLAVTGSLTIAVGRLRKLLGAPNTLTLFTVGDQLLWGAAEPLRRTLRMVVERSEELGL